MSNLKVSDTSSIVTEQKKYKGVKAVNIRTYVTTQKYTGPTQKGLWIPVDKWDEFKAMVNSVEVV